MHDFRQLRVWQLAREFATGVDAATRSFPRVDRGVVSTQLRRAALSIPANIAEGCGKSSRRETVRFLQIASGSAREAEIHLMIASDLCYINERTRDHLIAKVTSIEKMLFKLIHTLRDAEP